MNKLSQVAIVLIYLMLMNGCEKMMSEKMSLDGSWQFKYDPQNIGIDQRWFDPDQEISGWENQAVPGEWPDGAYDGFGWYRTTFKYGHLADSLRLALVFESVDDNAIIWLNGKHIGDHNGWGEMFFIDLTDLYQPNKENQLVVRIEDLGGPGGINKSVTLKPYRKLSDLYASEVSKKIAPTAPEWAQDAVIYEVFVRDYSEAGTFKALENDLTRLDSLGVDMIWLMPIHPTGKVKAKGSFGSPYAVADYYGISPEMGTLADFKSLVSAVHRHGKRLILDFVLNHSAWDNPLITTHPEWYTHNASGEIISPNADWYDVADLDYNQSGLRDYMIEMLQWWITETDIDGYRFDVAELVPNDFWIRAKAACQEVKPEVFFLAEGAKPELHLSGHDMTYSWNVWDLLTQVAQGKTPVSRLKQTIEMEKFQYPQGSLRMRFTENHDKERSRAYIGDAELNLTAWAFVALMDGNPLIYAGQEIGATHKPGLFEKEVVQWSKGDRNLEKQMSDILKLRKKYLNNDSPFKIILADDQKKIIAYQHDPIVAFFNFSDEPFTFKAHGAETILAGGLIETPSGYLLPAKQFGVFK